MKEHGQSPCTNLRPFLKCYVLYLVNSLSYWTPNGEFSGIQKLPVNPKDPPNISPPNIRPPNIRPPNTSPPEYKLTKKCLRTSISTGLI